MKRVFWVALVLAMLALCLVGTARYKPAPVADELLAYEITEQSSLAVNIPAGVDLALVTVWGIADNHVPPADETFSIPLVVRKATASGTEVERRDYLVQTRFSPAQSEEGPQLAEGTGQVAQPRTVELDLSAISGAGGRLSVGLQHQREPTRALIRLSYRFARTTLERDLLQRGLSKEDTERLVADTTALGFSDLPSSAQATALATWGRRLTAVGRTGVDYRQRRLLLPTRAAARPPEPQASLGFTVDPTQHAAFNLSGPVDLTLYGPKDGHVQLLSRGQERSVRLGDAGLAEVALHQEGLRTVVLKSDAPIHLRASIPSAQGRAQRGDIERLPLPDNQLELLPDVRTHTYYRLDPDSPLTFSTAPNQGPFRLRLRAVTEAPILGSRAQELTAVLTTRLGQTRKATLSVAGIHSYLETFGEQGYASEATFAHLFVDPETTTVSLHGPTTLALAVMVGEPAVEASIPAPAYVLPPSLSEHFQNIPYELTRWTTIRPDDVNALILQGRKLGLRAQVHLVENAPIASEGPALQEVAAYPVGNPARRTLLVEKALDGIGDDETLANLASYWFPIAAFVVQLEVPNAGPDAGQLRLRYEAAPAALGRDLVLSVDGQEQLRQTLRLPSGSLTVPVSPGTHSVAFPELPPNVRIASATPPANATTGLRRYSTFELKTNSSLSFDIERTTAATVHLVVFAATVGVGDAVRLDYEIDQGAPRRRSALFVAHATEPTGSLLDRSGNAGTGRLWEGRGDGLGQAGDGLARFSIRLGDDLAGARHRVTLRLPKGAGHAQRLFIRAVAVGPTIKPRAEQHRMYIGDLP